MITIITKGLLSFRWIFHAVCEKMMMLANDFFKYIHFYHSKQRNEDKFETPKHVGCL